MSNEYQQNLSEYENEFAGEVKGYGSLSPYCSSLDAASDKGLYVGYDIHPENIEALYFEGLKVPRWESIEAETVAQQEELYKEAYQKSTSEFPLISRVSDTDQKIKYSPEDVLRLQEECKRVLDDTNDAGAVRALLKFYIACDKAAQRQSGLVLIPN